MADEILKRLIELKQGQVALRQHVDLRSDAIEARLSRIETRLENVETGLKQLSSDHLDLLGTTTSSFEMIALSLERLSAIQHELRLVASYLMTGKNFLFFIFPTNYSSSRTWPNRNMFSYKR